MATLRDVSTVWEFKSGRVSVFDSAGRAMPQYSGVVDDVAKKLAKVDVTRVCFLAHDMNTGKVMRPTMRARILREAKNG